MQVVGKAEHDQVDFAEIEQSSKVGEMSRNSSFCRESLGVPGRGRRDGDDFCARN